MLPGLQECDCAVFGMFDSCSTATLLKLLDMTLPVWSAGRILMVIASCVERERELGRIVKRGGERAVLLITSAVSCLSLINQGQDTNL